MKSDDGKPRVQVALVSAQPTPNLTPAIDPRTRPDEVMLVVSPDMRERADWLEDTLRPRGIRVSRWPIDNAWDINSIRDAMMNLVFRHDQQALELNATGGTKPMSIAAFEVFREMDLPIFYVHPGTDRLVWMHPWERKGFDLADRVRLNAFLQAHGAKVEGEVQRTGVPAPLRTLGESLVQDVERLSRPLATLNWLAARARNDALSVSLSADRWRDSQLAALLEAFEAAGALSFDRDGIRFSDENARFFANGGWLEEHIFAVVQGMRQELPEIQDLARSLEVSRGQAGKAVRNELDVVFLADNRLYVIECKTKRFSEAGPDGPGAEALYKLDTLAPMLGGIGARAMLASFQQLHDRDRHRANELRIETCVAGELQAFKERLRRWIGKGH